MKLCRDDDWSWGKGGRWKNQRADDCRIVYATRLREQFLTENRKVKEGTHILKLKSDS